MTGLLSLGTILLAWHAAAQGQLVAGSTGNASAPKPGMPPGVTVPAARGGRVYADSTGRTLYTFIHNAGPATCTGPCAQLWQPLPAGMRAKPIGDWSIVRIIGDAPQWAHRKRPVFTFARDENPGDLHGDRVTIGNRTWHALEFQESLPSIVPAPSGVSIQRVAQVWALTDASGRPLYIRSTRAARATPHRTADSVLALRPFLAPLAATSGIGQWSLVRGPDGSKQWAYRGQALYVGGNAQCGRDAAESPCTFQLAVP